MASESGPRLLADVGATFTRLAVQRPGGTPEAIRVSENDDHSDLACLIENYLDETTIRPVVAALAVAGPVAGSHVYMPNRGWSFSVAEYRKRLDLEQLVVVNDFTAVALAIPQLSTADRVQVGSGQAQADAAIAVLGPGTGLGVSGLVPGTAGRAPITGEGGHATLAADNEQEEAILGLLREELGHVSAERVVSGPGLLRLYQALGRLHGIRADSEFPAEITRRALSGDDPLAVAALEQFFAWLGSIAGNIALILGARGGVYLAGGIVPRLIEPLRRSAFRRRFVAKGRYQDYLEAIPTFVITAEHPALRGLIARLDGKM